MEIGSVSSSVTAAASAQVRAQPSPRDQQGLQALLAQRAQQTSAEQQQAVNQGQPTEQNNRPTVNTSGQTVGAVINVTA